MSKFRFELNKKGVSELLKSDEMANVLNKYASRALSTLGEGYEASSFVGFDRVHAVVSARSYAARRENSESNTLLKSLGG